MNRIPFILLTLLLLVSCEKSGFESVSSLVPRTADQDNSIPSIQVNNAILHSEAFGNPADPLVVVVHGGPGADYRHLLPCQALADHGYRVVFYDQRGSGLSQRFPYDSYATDPMQQMYGDLEGVINYYRSSPGQKVFLLGHSWGAMLSSAYINTHPGKIDGLVICEPGGLVWQDVVAYTKRQQQLNFFAEPINDAAYSDQFLTSDKDDHDMSDYRFGLFLATAITSTIPEGEMPVWRGGWAVMNALFSWGNEHNPDWSANLRDFDTKVLFIYSDLNKAYGEAHARKVAGAFPNVEMFQATGTGHFMLTFPAGWAQCEPVIVSYLNSLK